MTTAEFSIDGSSSQVAHAVAFNTNVALAIVNTVAQRVAVQQYITNRYAIVFA